MPLVLSGTDGVSGVDGTASNPAIEGTDSNTGIFYPAADTVAIGTGGTERLRVDSAGNAGLGVTPSAWASSSQAFQNQAGSLFTVGNGSLRLFQNAYYNSSAQNVYVNTAAASGYIQTAGSHQWFYAPSGTAGAQATFTQAMTLDADGDLIVGATSGTDRLHVERNWDGSTWIRAVNTNSGSGAAAGVLFQNNTGDLGAISLLSSGQTLANALFLRSLSTNPLVFGTNNTERARITSGGDLLVAKTSVALGTAGSSLNADGIIHNTVAEQPCLLVNRLGNDGELVRFYQATTQEGNISVAGTTVSYNGGHLSRYAQTQAAKDDSLLKGTVLSNLDEMNVYSDEEGNTVNNEQLNKVKVSDVEGDVNVAGVFVNWSYDEQHQVDEINMAMTGDMIIRIAQGVTVQKGDLLMSAGDGTAKPQGDDIVRSKTIAKVTSNHVTCTYDDGSYCVPCVLMAC